MGNQRFRRWIIGLSLLLGSCGGGQTGQPTRGGAGGACGSDEGSEPLNLLGGLSECCRSVEADESIDGVSARDIVAARGTVEGVPLFWTDLATTGAAVYALEAEHARQTALSIQVTLDESAPIQFCNEVSLEIPVHVAVTTEDGFEAEFSSTWHWGPFFEAVPSGALNAPAAAFPLPGSHAEVSSNCSALFDFDRLDTDTVQGRFCSAEQGLALFPTACGGIAQLSSSQQPPYSHFEAPSQTLAAFEGISLVHENLPALRVSMTLSDPTACYSDPEHYWIAADFTFETGGITFTTPEVLGQTGVSEVTVNEETSMSELGLRVEFQRHCGDVSESPAWQALPGATDGLCVALSQTKFQDGTVQRIAEVSFEGASTGWVFSEF